MMSLRKKNLILGIINDMLVDLPTPSNISYWWNFGSLLGMCLIMQLISGLLLSMHYCSSADLSFLSVIHIIRDVNSGWMVRIVHMNTASLFFLCLFMHLFRGVYYSLYKNKLVWLTGALMLVMVMATAFMGYVLPWGQMSFWGATVITNLLSAVPAIGKTLVVWIWGGYSVDSPTLARFFALHFALPFLITAMVMIHLTLLHTKGSSNPMGVNSNMDKMPMHPFFLIKDLMGLILTLTLMSLILMISPYTLSDPENFIAANPMMTPTHIQPEWYFLFAYAILRSIPSKVGGVLGLVGAILLFMIMPFTNKSNMNSMKFQSTEKKILWVSLANFILLTWLGAMPVEPPYVLLGQISSALYLIMLILMLAFIKMNNPLR